jgi:hypothetical protein
MQTVKIIRPSGTIFTTAGKTLKEAAQTMDRFVTLFDRKVDAHTPEKTIKVLAFKEVE